MRYSTDKIVKPTTPADSDLSNKEFLESLAVAQNVEGLQCALLFVGGSDWRSIAFRRAQAPLRFDRRASLWSHVALVTHWDAACAGNSVGLEVTVEPPASESQVPERNGVTAFCLERYFDSERYPNIALVMIELGDAVAEGAANGAPNKDTLLDAVRNPCRNAERYPLWSSLSTWARYAYAPELLPSPLLEGIAMPCAALCEYAFAAARVDLTPGATGNHTCPEVLWATINHWQTRMLDQASFEASMLLRDAGCTAPDALPMTIPLPDIGQFKR